MARGKPNPMMLGVLGLAVAALMTDRFLTSASADDDAGAASENAGTDASSVAPAESRRSGPTLAERFSAFEPSENTPDFGGAFASLEPERELVQPEKNVAETAEPEVGLKLTAVLRRPDGNIAVINGRPMREGQSLDGCRVVSIGDDGVRVETEVGPITLTIDHPTLGG